MARSAGPVFPHLEIFVTHGDVGRGSGCALWPQPSSAMVLDALFPSVENSLLVLIPRSPDAFIPVLSRERFKALPVHLLIVPILGEIEAILIGQSIMLVGLSRCRIVRLVMSFEKGLVT